MHPAPQTLVSASTGVPARKTDGKADRHSLRAIFDTLPSHQAMGLRARRVRLASQSGAARFFSCAQAPSRPSSKDGSPLC